jgi:uncharacterized protein (TIGR03067 family)
MRGLLVALPLLLSLPVWAVPNRTPPPTDDLPKFQGAWDIYLLDGKDDGEAVERDTPTFRFTVTKNAYKAKHTGGNVNDESGTLKLTPKDKLGHLEFTILEGDDNGKKQLGLYRVEGEHILISLGSADGERPKNFDPREATLVGRMKKVK